MCHQEFGCFVMFLSSLAIDLLSVVHRAIGVLTRFGVAGTPGTAPHGASANAVENLLGHNIVDIVSFERLVMQCTDILRQKYEVVDPKLFPSAGGKSFCCTLRHSVKFLLKHAPFYKLLTCFCSISKSATSVTFFLPLSGTSGGTILFLLLLYY